MIADTQHTAPRALMIADTQHTAPFLSVVTSPGYHLTGGTCPHSPLVDVAARHPQETISVLSASSTVSLKLSA